MIMEELENVDKAIEFAKEQDDAELWEDLISYSIDKPRKIQRHNTDGKYLANILVETTMDFNTGCQNII